MSFRHTAISQFLYKHGLTNELLDIGNALNKYGHFTWHSTGHDPELGYFHGVIKDLDDNETRANESEILKALEEAGVRIKIVYEN